MRTIDDFLITFDLNRREALFTVNWAFIIYQTSILLTRHLSGCVFCLHPNVITNTFNFSLIKKHL